MNLATFEKWLARCGEERLSEQISTSQRASRATWERRNDDDFRFGWPAWDLCISFFWEENIDEWHARWVRCGGTLYEDRMIATKWDGIPCGPIIKATVVVMAGNLMFTGRTIWGL